MFKTKDAKSDPLPAATELYPQEALTNELETQGDLATAFGDKSPGVRRIEALVKGLSPLNRYILWITVLLVAYAYTLDNTLRYAYQTTAVSGYGHAAQIATVSVVRSIMAAAAQPLYAKISDYFGRLSILVLAIILYVIGTILQAASHSLGTFLGGAVIFQFGWTGVQLLIEILIADTTPLQSRVLFSIIPSAPYLINSWVSGDISQAILGSDGQGKVGWRWGTGMWGIIVPAICVPLFAALVTAEVRSKKAGLYDGIPSPFKAFFSRAVWTDIFWQIDIVGIVLIAGAFIMILLPPTLYGGSGPSWKQASAIAPIVVGAVVVVPMFIIWELRFAKHPAVPFRLLKDRQVLACLAIAMILNMAWYCQYEALYYLLAISFNQTTKHIGYITTIYTFVSTLTTIILGFVVRFVHRLKWFVVFGCGLAVVAFGILIRFRSPYHGGVGGVIAGEVLLGISFGLFSYPCQTLIQSAVQHERVAIVTALYLASYSIGSAVGNTISGSIWINEFPKEAAKQIAAFGISNATVINTDLYATPLAFSYTWAMGTPEREAAIHVYSALQRKLCIAGISIISLIFIVSLFLRNPYLGATQSLPNAEGFELNQPQGPIPALSKEGHSAHEGSQDDHSREKLQEGAPEYTARSQV